MPLSTTNSQHNNALHYAESGCTECGILFIVMLSVVMLNVIMLSAVASRDNAELFDKDKESSQLFKFYCNLFTNHLINFNKFFNLHID
jgi:hypothetical protein